MKKITDKIPAVVYARYSSHSQTEQSIEGQLRDAYAFAEKEGYKIIHEYIDRAQSGKTDDRTSFQRMIADASKRQFEVVLVWKLDRFARNRYDSATYKARLKRDGVRVVSIMERIGDSTEGIILEGLLESMAEYYSANLSENIKRGIRESRMKGLPVGGLPYGYTRDQSGQVVPDQYTAPIIKEVFKRYASGERMSDIVNDFNGRGILSPSGKKIRMSTYAKCLRHPYYIGRQYEGREEYPCPCPALIDDDTFARVQEIAIAHKHTPGAAKAKIPYLLTGKIRCGICGQTMAGECGVGKTHIQYYYYKCRGAKIYHNCTKKPEPKDDLESYVFGQTMAYILADGQKEKIADAIVAYLGKDPTREEMCALEHQIGQIELKQSNLIETLSEAPKAIRGQIYTKIEAYQAQADALRDSLQQLRISASIQITREAIIQWLDDFCTGNPADPEYRERLVNLLVNCVYVYDDMILVFYNIGSVQQQVKNDPAARMQPGSNSNAESGAGAIKSETGVVSFQGGVLCFSMHRQMGYG